MEINVQSPYCVSITRLVNSGKFFVIMLANPTRLKKDNQNSQQERETQKQNKIRNGKKKIKGKIHIGKLNFMIKTN
jgi:hypothetical protein